MDTFIGALTGGFFALLGVYIQYSRQEKREELKENKFLLSLLTALKTEIEVVSAHYMSQLGTELDALPKDGSAEKFFSRTTFPIKSDFFPIYHSNTEHIGLIHDDKLRSNLIKSYNLAKGFIDSIVFNNEMRRELDEIWLKTEKNEKTTQLFEEKNRMCTNYSKILYETHKNLMTSIPETISLLKEQILLVDQDIKNIEHSIGWGLTMKSVRQSVSLILRSIANYINPK